MATDRDLPIPDALNTALVFGVLSAEIGLIALSTQLHSAALHGVALLGCAIAYAAVFQTGFALLHEASHLKLHSDPARNRLLGQLVGIPFGLSVTMFGITHWSHHLKNRSTEETFDQILPGESRWPKTIGWYGMLLSLWYWLMPAMNLLLLFAPGPLRAVTHRLRIGDRIFAAPPEVRRQIRVELSVWLVVWVAVVALVGWRALLLQGLAAWVWASSNYVEHSYAPLDIREGAFNLSAPRWLSWLNLHRELDWTHHRWPDASWIHLPRLSSDRHGRWFVHWLRQWRGPVPSAAIPPPPVETLAPMDLP